MGTKVVGPTVSLNTPGPSPALISCCRSGVCVGVSSCVNVSVCVWVFVFVCKCMCVCVCVCECVSVCVYVSLAKPWHNTHTTHTHTRNTNTNTHTHTHTHPYTYTHIRVSQGLDAPQVLYVRIPENNGNSVRSKKHLWYWKKRFWY
jgi:hypothetical protein